MDYVIKSISLGWIRGRVYSLEPTSIVSGPDLQTTFWAMALLTGSSICSSLVLTPAVSRPLDKCQTVDRR